MSNFKSLRTETRKDYSFSGERASLEQLNLGALLRIADATEAMAKRHTELIGERDRMERLAWSRLDRITKLERQLAAQKGIVTRMKNKAKGAAA